MNTSQYLTKPAAARLLGISIATFDRRLRDGVFRPVASVRKKPLLFERTALLEAVHAPPPRPSAGPVPIVHLERVRSAKKGGRK